MTRIAEIENAARKTGFREFGYVKTDKLVFSREVRSLCEENKCRNYNTSWACPPAIGTIAQCKARAAQYGKMMVFSQVYPLEDSYDFEGMLAGLRDFKQMVDRFQQNLSGIPSDFLLLSNEGCGRCASCTYPDEPCRFPQLLHHSLEGYGFIVHDLAKAAGIRYHNGPDTVTFFGALLFHEEKGDGHAGTAENEL